jgi:UDP-glucose 4-epimerase
MLKRVFKKGDIKKSIANTARAKKALSFQAKMNLNDGFRVVLKR